MPLPAGEQTDGTEQYATSTDENSFKFAEVCFICARCLKIPSERLVKLCGKHPTKSLGEPQPTLRSRAPGVVGRQGIEPWTRRSKDGGNAQRD